MKSVECRQREHRLIAQPKKKLLKFMLQVCLQQSWPQDKPISPLVFPQIVPSRLGNLATLWVMLPKQEISHYLYSKPYRHFHFLESPYPMLLWISTLHAPEHNTRRLLPCYLDLKDTKSVEIVQRLAQTGYYRVLLFGTDQPQRCTQVMTVTLNPDQCQGLKKWIEKSQILKPKTRPIESKKLLKAEVAKLKSQASSNLDFNNLDFCLKV